VPINEKIHWSVIERLGRAAFVDERLSKNYAPSNLPLLANRKVWREEDRAALEQDPRVAQMTREEVALIKACRNPLLNRRLQNCALFSTLNDTHLLEQKPFSLAALRSYFSTHDRRIRRLIGLRKIWRMGQAPPY
jgi:hypothetical protein